jgi:hypothetical protein
MMKRSNRVTNNVRGAAKVSVVWAICFFMAFAAAAVAYFLANQESASHQQRAETAEAARKKAEAELQAEKEYMIKTAQKTGFGDPMQQSRIDPAALDAGMTLLKGSFPQIDGSVTNLQGALPIVIEAYKAEQAKAKEAEAKAAQLTAENSTIRANVDTISAEKTQEVTELRRQLSDSEDSFNNQKGELQRQLDERAAGLVAADGKANRALTELEDLKRKASVENDAWRARMAEATRKLTPFEKEPEAADGRVLAVSNELHQGWISVGSKNRLTKGTRFRVVDGQQGSKKLKAWAEVTNVDADMAQVAFSEQVDPFDSPVVGDVVFNPLFDPTGDRSAVLIGRFSAPMTQDSLSALLKSMNISVSKSVDKTTDFLIVGGEMYNDPESGAPLDTPLQPSDLPVFKEAQAQGVQIVSLKELRQFFRAAN